MVDALEFVISKKRGLNDETLVLILNMILTFGLEVSIAPLDFISVSLDHMIHRKDGSYKCDDSRKLCANALITRVFHSSLFVGIKSREFS